MRAEELSIKQMIKAFEVLSHMYPDLSSNDYEGIIKQRSKDGYRMVGVIEDYKTICVAGFWTGVRFYCGKYIQIDNMVTLPKYRSTGTGKILTDWIKELAKRENCNRIILDSYVENYDAHRFFFREGFIIRGYHLNYIL